MTFPLRLLRLVSILAIIAGVMMKLNQWASGNLLLNLGLFGLGLGYVGEFIIQDKTRKR